MKFYSSVVLVKLRRRVEISVVWRISGRPVGFVYCGAQGADSAFATRWLAQEGDTVRFYRRHACPRRWRWLRIPPGMAPMLEYASVCMRGTASGAWHDSMIGVYADCWTPDGASLPQTARSNGGTAWRSV